MNLYDLSYKSGVFYDDRRDYNILDVYDYATKAMEALGKLWEAAHNLTKGIEAGGGCPGFLIADHYRLQDVLRELEDFVGDYKEV